MRASTQPALNRLPIDSNGPSGSPGQIQGPAGSILPSGGPIATGPDMSVQSFSCLAPSGSISPVLVIDRVPPNDGFRANSPNRHGTKWGLGQFVENSGNQVRDLLAWMVNASQNQGAQLQPRGTSFHANFASVMNGNDPNLSSLLMPWSDIPVPIRSFINRYQASVFV